MATLILDPEVETRVDRAVERVDRLGLSKTWIAEEIHRSRQNVSEVLNKAHAGAVFDYENVSGVRQFLDEQYTAWTPGQLENRLNRGYLEEYARPALARRLAAILDSISGK